MGGSLSVLLQLALDGVCLAGIYALLGSSWAIVFNTTRVFHIAHGVTFAAGGYTVLLVLSRSHLPLALALLVALAVGAILGLVFHLLLYEPLRRRGSEGMITFVASLGAMGLCSALLLALFGANPVIPSIGLDSVINLGPGRLTEAQLLSGVVAAVVTVALLVSWRLTWPGRAFRAVTSNPEAAAAVGIKVARYRLFAMALGGALAGTAGGLASLFQGASLDMVLNGVLVAATAVLVGGIGSLPGAAVGGVLVALAMNLGIWRVSSRWQYSIVFGLLLIFMLIRPRGLLGERLAQAEL